MVIPSGVIGWYVAIIIGLLIYTVAESFCPEEYIVSGACAAPWAYDVYNTTIIFGVCLSAILVILFSVYMAPDNRALIAKLSYLLGFVFATYFAYKTKEWGAYFGAVISGALLLIHLLRKFKKQNKSH